MHHLGWVGRTAGWGWSYREGIRTGRKEGTLAAPPLGAGPASEFRLQRKKKSVRIGGGATALGRALWPVGKQACHWLGKSNFFIQRGVTRLEEPGVGVGMKGGQMDRDVRTLHLEASLFSGGASAAQAEGRPAGRRGAEGELVPKHFVPTDEQQLAAQLITEEAKHGTRQEPSGVVSGEQGPRGRLSHREGSAVRCQEHKGQVSGTTGSQGSPSSLQGLHTQIQITALLPTGVHSRGGEQAP